MEKKLSQILNSYNFFFYTRYNEIKTDLESSGLENSKIHLVLSSDA